MQEVAAEQAAQQDAFPIAQDVPVEQHAHVALEE